MGHQGLWLECLLLIDDEHKYRAAILEALGRQRQEDPWGLLTDQSSILAGFQASERPCLKKAK